MHVNFDKMLEILNFNGLMHSNYIKYSSINRFRLSKAGAALVNTISSIVLYMAYLPSDFRVT